jgi:predicted DNA-binding protein
VPTKAVTVRVPIEVVEMLKTITEQTGQTNKEAIESMIRRAYDDLSGK